MVKIKIDLEHREKLRRLHTATHILNWASKKVLGNHIWQNGSNLKPELGTLDITHYENLTENQIFEIEKIVNNIIFENKSIEIEEMDRTKAEQKYGFTLYQGGAIPMKTLRIIKIQDSDIEACGGLHMEQTGPIGLLKIVDTQKIQDGVVRVKFVVNNYALEFINSKQKTITEIKQILEQNDEKTLTEVISKINTENKENKKKISSLKLQLRNNYVEQINNLKSNEFKLDEDYDMAFLMELFNETIKFKKSFKLISSKFIIASNDIEIKKFKKQINKKIYSIYIM